MLILKLVCNEFTSTIFATIVSRKREVGKMLMCFAIIVNIVHNTILLLFFSSGRVYYIFYMCVETYFLTTFLHFFLYQFSCLKIFNHQVS